MENTLPELTLEQKHNFVTEALLEAYESLKVKPESENPKDILTNHVREELYYHFNGMLSSIETDNFKISNVEEEGGYEGGGEHMHVVNKFENKITGRICYVKIEGTYSSWDSSEIGDLTFVKPIEKTITVYTSL